MKITPLVIVGAAVLVYVVYEIYQTNQQGTNGNGDASLAPLTVAGGGFNGVPTLSQILNPSGNG